MKAIQKLNLQMTQQPTDPPPDDDDDKSDADCGSGGRECDPGT